MPAMLDHRARTEQDMGCLAILHGKLDLCRIVSRYPPRTLAFTAAGWPPLRPRCGPRRRRKVSSTWGCIFRWRRLGFDPCLYAGIITQFMVMYALARRRCEAMPGKSLAPCLPSPFSGV